MWMGGNFDHAKQGLKIFVDNDLNEMDLSKQIIYYAPKNEKIELIFLWRDGARYI